MKPILNMLEILLEAYGDYRKAYHTSKYFRYASY